MDIKIVAKNSMFKYRVSGMIIHQDKILLVRMCNNKFWCLPGGHVEIGETSSDAIKRELKEETKYDVQEVELIEITENFFTRPDGLKLHELGFYYLCRIKDSSTIEDEEYIVIEGDKENGKIKLEFKWFPLNEIKNIVFKPEFLVNKIEQKDFKLMHHIIC